MSNSVRNAWLWRMPAALPISGFNPPYIAPKAKRPSRATKYIYDTAAMVRAAGVTVDCDSAFSTVAIDGPCDGVDYGGDDGCGQHSFMQGDQADEFIERVEALCKRYPSLPPDVAELALAAPYVESWE